MRAQLPPWLDRARGLARVDFELSQRQPSTVRVWLAVLVTLVLWLPDLYLLDLGQPGRAVAVLTRVPAVGSGGYAGR